MEWFNGSVAEAVAEAKRNNKLFLVYIEGPDDMSKEMSNTYNDAAVAQKLSAKNIVAIKLAANSVPYVQFCAIYPVLIIPSSYFIGVNGNPIEIITGSLVPTEFAAKIDKIIENHEKFSPAVKGTISSQPSSSKDFGSSSNSCDVASSDSSHPSTSQESESEANIAPPLGERLERAKALLEVKKQIQEEEEKKKEKQQELERRNVGKALQKSQQEKKDNELKEWANNRAKEKEEERLAREKVRALIAQDRAERAAKYQQFQEGEKERISKAREEQDRVARAAALNSNEARIQFRLPNGACTNHVFSADASLDDVRIFVRQEVRPPFSHFSLCTTFPRRHFIQSNYSESLRDLQLAPSAVLLILPEQSVTHVNSPGGFWSMVFWSLMRPFIYSWQAITSIFSGAFQSREQPSQPTSDSSPKSSNEPSSSHADGARRRDAGFVRREGNIYRLSNQGEDGENNTWNGNSTQQM